MSKKTANRVTEPREQEFDFALIVSGVDELTGEVEDALFGAGCDDATLSMQYGRLYLEFSRSAPSLREAIVSAIRDVHHAGIGAQVLRVDECSLVTAADIARLMGRSRQLVHQYINAQRGPGRFPPPECHLADHSPLWRWCAVSSWLVQNNLIRPEESSNAEVIEAINIALESARRPAHSSKLVKDVARELELSK